MICLVFAAISPSMMAPVCGSIGSWPETKSSDPVEMACE